MTMTTTPTEIELLATDEHRLRVQLREHEIKPHDVYVLPPGSKHFPGGVVMRYMVQYDDGNGRFGCVGASQGRYTNESLTPAQSKLKSLLKNNTPDKLALYGGAKALFVGFVACYPVHFDPAPIDLGSTPLFPADIFNMRTLQRLGEHILRARRDYPPES